MITIETIIRGANTNSRAVRRAIGGAQDAALTHHRNTMLPFHFLASAKHRYPGGAFVKRGLKDRHYKRGKEKRKAANKGRKKIDRKNKIPLFSSGILKSKVLKGGVTSKGRWDRREVKYTPPFYLFISRSGEIDKKAAISATNDTEEREMVKVAGELFLKNLESNKTTKRG
jgi:hypothetical protein